MLQQLGRWEPLHFLVEVSRSCILESVGELLEGWRGVLGSNQGALLLDLGLHLIKRTTVGTHEEGSCAIKVAKVGGDTLSLLDS